MSDTLWLAIIGIVAMIVKDYLDGRRASAAAAKVEQVAAAAKVVAAKTDEVAVKAEAVRVQVIAVAVKNDARIVLTEHVAQKVDVLSAQVEEVHRATNSLTDRLVAATEAEALVRGGVEERSRAEARAASAVKDGTSPADVSADKPLQ